MTEKPQGAPTAGGSQNVSDTRTIDSVLAGDILEFNRLANEIEKDSKLTPAQKAKARGELFNNFYMPRIFPKIVGEEAAKRFQEQLKNNQELQKALAEKAGGLVGSAYEGQQNLESKTWNDIISRFDKFQTAGLQEYFSTKTAPARMIGTISGLAAGLGAILMFFPGTRSLGEKLITQAEQMTTASAKRIDEVRLEVEELVKKPTGLRPKITADFASEMTTFMRDRFPGLFSGTVITSAAREAERSGRQIYGQPDSSTPTTTSRPAGSPRAPGGPPIQRSPETRDRDADSKSSAPVIRRPSQSDAGDYVDPTAERTQLSAAETETRDLMGRLNAGPSVAVLAAMDEQKAGLQAKQDFALAAAPTAGVADGGSGTVKPKPVVEKLMAFNFDMGGHRG